VGTARATIGGKSAEMITYNQTYPGPTITVKRGDTLRLHLLNNLPITNTKNVLGFEKNHTNLHTHGLHVSPEPPADDAHVDIPPGSSYDYVYDLSLLYPGTLNIYHPHCHGLVAEQYWAGLIGAVVVADDVPVLNAFATNLMILKDFEFDANGKPTAYTSSMDYMSGKEGSLVTVNGRINPVVTIAPGEIQRWRILNGSNARFYKLSLQGLPMYLVGTDGGLLDKPYLLTSLLLSPGERADLLVKADVSFGTYKLVSLPYARSGGMGGMSCRMGGSQPSAQITLLTATVKGAQKNHVLPSIIDAGAYRLSPDTAMISHRKLTLSMGMGRGYINGQDFDVSPYTIMSNVNTYEIWEIVNQSGMDHPFHQHTDAAQVLSISGGDSSYANMLSTTPAMKDVVIVPKMGSVRLLVPVMDWKGMAMFHCHILEHEDIGMMGMWHRMSMPIMIQ
jgi:FtsP/CotA-like multicopper oxidase with cupredoxin domain